ncbi:hypothetical protein Cgig2_007894 [Carnegiea gigantea]|uniref:Leucine-rich repeat-containing N-terminal plant-type domain-containing protein n=1 Tax=Carnegiea gigantea TaxID=171969 RepID=A0A9Q1KFU2_9CARY|nr:hypothetical protein Cgig2_007894 [Carnegiea gigantea]
MRSYRCIKVKPSPDEVFLLLAWLMLACFGGQVTGSSTGALNNIQCIPEERQALLNFKKGLKYDSCGLLASRTDQEHDEDCCQWYGIRCNNLTGHVIMLDLRLNHQCYLDIEGNISSLLDLKHLEYLDLSGHNFFPSLPIHSLIGSLHSLKYLNLSSGGFAGEIPHQLANLSSLTSLDLSNNNGLCSKSLGWLSHMTLLRDIDLSGIDLSAATDWMHSVNNLPHLRVLRMDVCGLPPPILSSLSYANSTATLRALSLAGNPSIGSLIILQWIFNLTRSNSHLEQLDLSSNDLTGPIPLDFQNMTALSQLDLSSNDLTGPIPLGFQNMTSLSQLDLSSNHLTGPIPLGFQNMASLSQLDLSSNHLTGPIPLDFQNMTSLSQLDLSSNRLTGPIPLDFQNITSLSQLDLSSNHLTGPIPLGFQNMASLSQLDLSSNHLTGPIPLDFQNMTSLSQLDLSSNRLTGPIPLDFQNITSLSQLDLSSNHLTGPIPLGFQNMASLSQLDLSNNELEGPISNAIFSKMQGLSYLDLSGNSLYSSIPRGLALLPRLVSLDLSRNQLSGIIPPLLGKLSPLQYIDLSNNGLSGPIPTQLEIFGSEHFEGNLLCGDYPFWPRCPQSERGDSGLTDTVDKFDKYFYMGLYLSIALGFYVGFCGFFGTLALKDSWRHRYFQLLDHIINWVYVTVALQVVNRASFAVGL